MKKAILFFVIISSSFIFSQSINDFKAVIIPLKYDFQRTDNQYRLQTLTKINLQKAGFEAFYSNEQLPSNLSDRCKVLYLDLKKDNNMMVTKVFVEFKDCYGKKIFESIVGKSREKEFETAYQLALNDVFANDKNLKYSQKETLIESETIRPNMDSNIEFPKKEVFAEILFPKPVPEMVPIEENATKENLLYAQATSYGFQLVDSSPKLVMKVYKTSNSAVFIAIKNGLQGVLFTKQNQWFYEYYENDKLISEKVELKF